MGALMLTTRITYIACAIIFSMHAGACATPRATALWQTLTELNGSWRLIAAPTEGERAFRINFRAISKGSALVETFGYPEKNVTQTVYHRNGASIMATHYCAQGNQPRLVLSPMATPGALSFTFFDITNLVNKSDSHLVRIDFKLIDRNHLERRETYLEKGVTEESILHLERVQ